MLRTRSDTRRRTLAMLRLGLPSLLVGCLLGLAAANIWPVWLAVAGPGAPPQEAGQKQGPHEEEEHVHLTEQGFKNLGLKIGPVQRSDYFRVASIPCEVVEKRGQSNLVIAAPVMGVVTRVHAFEGQAIKPGDPLFDLTVTDEELTIAQLELLDVRSQLDVLDAEIERLAPLTESGVVEGARMLKLEYDKKQLEAKRQLRRQELQVRGLTLTQVESIVAEKKLIREFTVYLTASSEADKADFSTLPASDRLVVVSHVPEETSQAATPRDDLEFSVEQLNAFPGKSVQRGEDMCHVAYHTVLLIKGQAFESDMENIARLRESGWTVTAELGHEGHEIVRENLNVLYVDNHVDADTQTFPFYVPITNEVLEDSLDEAGRVYRSWRFKPGQRGHVIIPVEKFAAQFKLPLAAIVQEGPEAFVFREHQEPEPAVTADAATQHEEEEIFIEFEPVPVHVLHQDADFAVIADDGQISSGEIIALNNAYKLNLTMKIHAGGGHDHHHDH